MASLVIVQSPKVWADFSRTSFVCSHVAAFQWFVSSLVQLSANLCSCGNFAITSVAVYPHTVQLLSLEPSASSVASRVVVQSPKVWAALPLTSFACPQIEACQWFVSSLVHSFEKR